MTQLDKLKRRIPTEPDDGILEEMLDSAKSVIMSTRYPYQDWPDEIEPRYMDLQLRMAEDMYNRIGASGQLSHSENGISRSWGSEWVSNQLVREVVPYLGVI